MTVFTEPNNLGDFLVWEEERHYSRDEVVILSGQTLALGEVVGKVTASGKYVAFNQDGLDGSQNAVGITIAAYDATSGDVAGVIIARDAIITTSNLVWPSDIEAAEITTALEQLAALGIITRGES